MSRKVPDVPQVPDVPDVPPVPDVPNVPPVPEAGPMETAILEMMAGFGEIICKAGEKIASIFKQNFKKK